MLRLTVVSGPGRGTSFKLASGENSIGRQLGNTVVLPSSQVSKRHCVLVASNGEILVRDQGSANGTFVNGVLTRSKKLQAGDRIGVGDYVLELSGSASGGGQQALPAIVTEQSPLDNVIAFPQVGSSDPMAAAMPIAGTGGESPENAMPKDLKGKAFWYLENYLMPIFYGFNLKNEWRVICAVVFAMFLILNLVISVQPLLNANSSIILKETQRRASFMARGIAERNSPFLSAGAESRTEIGIAENAEGVSMALLTDMDNRIIAPADRMNQYVVSGPEARFANEMAGRFRKGAETGVRKTVDDLVIAIEPVKVYDPKLGRNNVVAMAIVSIDASIAMMGIGEAGIVYSETLILTALLGALMLFILYRMTLKPFQILNEDMDKALKGDLAQVTHEFKMEELNPLWDLINSSLQRIPRSSGNGGGDLGGMGGEEEAKPEQFVGPIRVLGNAAKIGVAVCGPDRKIVYMNEMFEELSGIRADSAVGQEFSAVARDQSLGVLVQDMFDRAGVGGDGVTEDYEFSGIGCQVLAAAFGAPGDMSAKSYVLAVVKKSD